MSQDRQEIFLMKLLLKFTSVLSNDPDNLKLNMFGLLMSIDIVVLVKSLCIILRWRCQMMLRCQMPSASVLIKFQFSIKLIQFCLSPAYFFTTLHKSLRIFRRHLVHFVACSSSEEVLAYKSSALCLVFGCAVCVKAPCEHKAFRVTGFIYWSIEQDTVF